MSFETKFKQDLVQILSAGGSFEIAKGARFQAEWVDLARAAKSGGGHLTITGVRGMFTHDIVAIAEAGPGHVTFVE